MTREEARDLLIRFNLWRRDDHIPNSYEMPNPKEVGIAIDIAIDALKDLINVTEKYNEFIKAYKKKHGDDFTKA